MAELLLSWLNDEVQLSRKVNNLDADWRSGYLFGEVLWKHNQQGDFGLVSVTMLAETKQALAVNSGPCLLPRKRRIEQYLYYSPFPAKPARCTVPVQHTRHFPPPASPCPYPLLLCRPPQFNKKLTPDNQIQNYCLLEPTLRRLNIKFDALVAYGIMQGKVRDR